MKIDVANLKFDEKGLIPAIVQDVYSDEVLMPPPTVRGMKTCPAVRLITSSIDLRFSKLAVMSKNTSSSARS